MNNQEDRLTPEQLPFQIEEQIGNILFGVQLYPDVYCVAVESEEHPLINDEYYIVLKNTKTLSQQVKNYGQAVLEHPEVLMYSLDEDKSGWRLVDYEGLKYLFQHGLPMPEQTSLHSAAIYGMELHPEYFGEYPVPTLTPAGYTLRSKKIETGLYWVETDQCKQMLAVCYPIWRCELSEFALSLGQKTEYDIARNIDETLGYLFFEERDSSIPLFELRIPRKDWKQVDCINTAALMNAVWQDFPEYAAAHNLAEQSGAGDFLGNLLRSFGVDVEVKISLEDMISMNSDIGTKFFCW